MNKKEKKFLLSELAKYALAAGTRYGREGHMFPENHKYSACWYIALEFGVVNITTMPADVDRHHEFIRGETIGKQMRLLDKRRGDGPTIYGYREDGKNEISSI